MEVEYRELRFPIKYQDRTTGEEKTLWKPAGGDVGINWEEAKIKVRLDCWPAGLWAFAFEKKEPSRGRQAPSSSPAPPPREYVPPSDAPPF
jgi:hypothetical protein